MSGELAFIEALRAFSAHPGARDLTDDAAVLEVGGEALVLTHDTMVEGIHFLPDQDPADVAWKLVASNISDLAAKGAEPLGVLLGYTLGTGDVRFVEGLQEALKHYAAPLLGGDTVSSPSTRTLGLTAIGRATTRPVPGRNGAQIGDSVWLTGAVGAAMIGLEALRSGMGESSAYRRPQARLAEGLALASQVTAMMDVSDGLLLDAWRMAQASGVTLSLASNAVPLACPEHRRDEALRWGDDYELLFTLPAEVQPMAPATQIGGVLEASAAPLKVDCTPLAAPEGLGFQHR